MQTNKVSILHSNLALKINSRQTSSFNKQFPFHSTQNLLIFEMMDAFLKGGKLPTGKPKEPSTSKSSKDNKKQKPLPWVEKVRCLTNFIPVISSTFLFS
jgi:hypothetical protein